MKKLKSEILLLGFVVSLIIVLAQVNYRYWNEMMPIYIQYAFMEKSEIFDKGLPPLPNPFVNDSTLLGIDLNNNGIRDDVDYWIIGGVFDYNEKMALTQTMKINQRLLQMAADNNIDGYESEVRQLWLANSCQDYIFFLRGSEGFKHILKTERYVFRNTKLREDISQNISKQTVIVYEKPEHLASLSINESYKYCNFKIKDLNNLIFRRNELTKKTSQSLL